MGESTSTHLLRLHGRLENIVQQLTRVQFSQLSSRGCWQPPVNAFLCDHAVTVCVELAGVEKERIDVRVEPLRLYLHGQRIAPDPCGSGHVVKQILAMEIDCGKFERVIELPVEIDTDRVTAEQHNGMLWVCMPFRGEA